MNWNRKEIFNRRRQRRGAVPWPLLLLCFHLTKQTLKAKSAKKGLQFASCSLKIEKIYFGKKTKR